MQPFDLLLITARDAGQRWLFAQRLATLPLERIARRVQVVADPPGAQAGSGGSTLYTLCAALDCLEIPLQPGAEGEAALQRALAGRRILVVHCGGLSQRVPQFASLGKAFAPSPGPGPDEPLFQKVVEGLHRLVEDFPPGVLVACGDILYETPPASALPADADAVVWAWPAELEQASRHGVFLFDATSGLVTDALQKQSLEVLRRHGCETTAPLDTGVVFFRPAVAAAVLTGLADRKGGTAVRQALRNDAAWRGLDLYGEWLPALTPAGRQRPTRAAARPLLVRLAPFRMAALCPMRSRFLHFGTTPELLALLRGRNGAPMLFNSVVESGEPHLAEGVVLHNCLLTGAVSIGAGSFVMGLRGGGVALDTNRLAYQLPIQGTGNSREALVALGFQDDPKQGAGATLMGTPLTEWAGARGLSEEALWGNRPRETRSFWNAALFPVVAPEDLSRGLDWLQGELPHATGPSWVPQRLSMDAIHAAFDAHQWWRRESGLRARLVAQRIAERVAAEPGLSIAQATADVPASLAPLVAGELARLARRHPRPLTAASLYRGCAELRGTEDLTSSDHRRAFGCIRTGLATNVARGATTTGPLRWHVAPGNGFEVRAPVRIDIAGAWSDTPPQACAEGGSVLNVALLLEDRMPLVARARVLSEPLLRFVAREQGQEHVCASLEELRGCQDPADPFALHKAALLEAGLDRVRARSLSSLLQSLGGGLELETDSQVPKGSGLGTSSILGAVVLASLFRLAGRADDWQTLFGAVLRLEQRMTTGGGWQDQVGGMLPGFKWTQTAPGWEQAPHVRTLTPPEGFVEALHARSVVFYTGLPRLAKNVLQRVVSRYLAREPRALSTLARMRALAGEAASAVEWGDLDQLGAALSESWALNQSLEPTATNPEIETLFAAAAPYCVGGKLAGAGGGGFALFIARSAADANALREVLREHYPQGRSYKAQVADLGLTTSPLDALGAPAVPAE